MCVQIGQRAGICGRGLNWEWCEGLMGFGAVENATRVDLGHGSSSGSDGHLLVQPRGDALTFSSCREATIKRKRPGGTQSGDGAWGRPYAGHALQHYTPVSLPRTLHVFALLTDTQS